MFDGEQNADLDDLLAGLVDKSLVLADRRARTTRYRQLETLRQFGAAMVERAGTAVQVRDRHLAHFAVEVARVERRYWGSEFGAADFGDAAAWYEAEWDNLRAALNHAIDTHNPGRAAAIVAHSFFYALYGMRLEHHDWAQRANAVAGAPPLITAMCAAWAFYAGDHERAEVLARQVLQGEADPAAVAHAWHAIFQVAFHSGRTRDMSDAIQQYRNAANDCEDNPALAHHVLAFSNVAAATLMNTGDAEHTANELRELADRAGNPILVASAKIAAGLVAVTRRDRETASRHFEQGADLFGALGVTLMEGMALVSRAIGMPLDLRNEAFRNAIRSFQSSRSWMLLWVLLESLGIGWATQGRYEPAAVLLGAIDSRQRHAAPLTNQRDRIQTSLGAHADFGTWAATGAQMTIDELIDYALANLDT